MARSVTLFGPSNLDFDALNLDLVTETSSWDSAFTSRAAAPEQTSTQTDPSPARDYEPRKHPTNLEDLLHDFQHFSGSDDDQRTTKEDTPPSRSYDLRPEVRERRNGSIWITWLDQDDSGTYDPARPNHRRKANRVYLRSDRGTREIRTIDDEFYSEGERLSRLAARQRGESAVVSFHLGTLLLQSLAAKIPDNWPSENHNILSDEHYQRLSDDINSRPDDQRRYNLRHRNFTSQKPRQEDDREDGGRLRDPSGEEPDLRNHPAARGCKACRMIFLECPLVREEGEWPCRHCREDDSECELIQKRLSRISYDRHRSSLPIEFQAQRAIQNAIDDEVSLPIAAELRQPVLKDVLLPHESQKKSQPVAHAQQNLEQASLLPDETRLMTAGQEESDQPDLKINSSLLPERKGRAEDNTKPAQQPTPILIDDSPLPPNAITITTALPHPISFNDSAANCDWCLHNIGLFGTGSRSIAVLPSSGGLSYKELNGPTQDPEKPSRPCRMCIRCTVSRVAIMTCAGHEVAPLPGLSVRIESEDQRDQAEDAMYDRALAGVSLPSDKWCALCPKLALHGCCTLQETDIWGESVAADSLEARGCGLLLCEECRGAFEELEHIDNVVEAMAADSGRGRLEGKRWFLGARADAELLKEEGLLMLSFAGRAGEEDVFDKDGSLVSAYVRSL